MHKPHLLIIGFIASSFWLHGCASSTPLSADSRTAIEVVSVTPEVTTPDRFFYQGSAQQVGMSFGLIGSLMGSAAAEGPVAQLTELMAESDIAIGPIVYAEFVQAWDQANLFMRTEATPADADLELKVLSYGLIAAQPFSSRLRAQIELQGTMMDRASMVVWQQVKRAAGPSDIGYTLDDFSEDPDRLRLVLQVATQSAVQRLIDDLR